MKKITRTTVKSFIKNNRERLYINLKREFDGMIDGKREHCEGFEVAKQTAQNIDMNMGIEKAWFVGSSRDYFTPFEDGRFTGIEVSNCCSNFILAVKK
jgi:hypothetical protein